MKHILFLTSLDLWGEGSVPQRAPGRTLKGYVDQGYVVSIISTQKRNQRYRSLCYDGYFPVLFDIRRLKSLSHMFKVVLLGLVFPICAGILAIIVNQRKKIDLIYGYEVHGVLAGQLCAWLLRKPFVSRYQGTVLYPLIAQNGSLIKKISKLDHLLSFRMRPTVTIMTDDGTKGDEVFNQLSVFPHNPFFFWRNGVEVSENLHEVDFRNDNDLDSSSLLVMTASRLVKWKGVDKAIHTFAGIRDIPNVYLVIVGDGTERCNLESLVAQLEIKDRVFFLGHIDQKRVQGLLKQASVFLSFYDLSNVGNPLLEALSSGIPILTVAEGDTGKVIQDGVNGLLLDKWNEKTAISTLRRLLTCESLRNNLSERAKVFSEKELWSWSDRIDCEMELISTILVKNL